MAVADDSGPIWVSVDHGSAAMLALVPTKVANAGAVDHGATLVTGGVHVRNFFEPTVPTGIKHGTEAAREKFLGLVAHV